MKFCLSERLDLSIFDLLYLPFNFLFPAMSNFSTPATTCVTRPTNLAGKAKVDHSSSKNTPGKFIQNLCNKSIN